MKGIWHLIAACTFIVLAIDEMSQFVAKRHSDEYWYKATDGDRETSR